MMRLITLNKIEIENLARKKINSKNKIKLTNRIISILNPIKIHKIFRLIQICRKINTKIIRKRSTCNVAQNLNIIKHQDKKPFQKNSRKDFKKSINFKI